MSETMEAATSVTKFNEGLNEAQRSAVEHDAGPLIVLAGPGSGKTHVIVRRLARLVGDPDQGGAGAEPESVVAMAYTVRAAGELQQRVDEMVGASTALRMRIGTSHSFGRSIVRRFGDLIGLPWMTHIADSAERIRLLRELAGDLKILRSTPAGLESALRDAETFINACHIDALSPERMEQWIDGRRRRLESGDHDLTEEDADAERAAIELDHEHARLYGAFERARLERGMLSLDDYLLLPIRILEESSRARDFLRAECRHIVVDEFQDWNPAQIRLLSLLAPPTAGGPNGPDVCVVGDDDQSIYAFRGADDRAFERFKSNWPGATHVALEINYRSEAPIIKAANAAIDRAESRFDAEKIIRVNPDRDAAPDARVEGVLAPADDAIGPLIATMIADDEANSDRTWSDYAVLARTHNEADKCAYALQMEGIPVNRRTKRTPLDDQAVRDLLAWTWLTTDSSRAHDAQRALLRPPIGADPRHVQEWVGRHRRARSEGDRRDFTDWLVETHAGDEFVDRFSRLLTSLREVSNTMRADEALHHIALELDVVHSDALEPRARGGRIEAVLAVLRFVRERADHIDPPGDLRAFLDHYEDMDPREQNFEHAGDSRVDAGEDEQDERGAGVSVLTAHSAKGLEFDTVFLPRVRPQFGYPLTQKMSEPRALIDDPELTGRHPTPPIDEERRLFYVACTRAERRLVLVAKKRKAKKSSSTDFFDELTQDSPRLEIPVTDGAELLERYDGNRADASDLVSDAPRGDVRDWLSEQILLARQHASGLLLDASQPDLSADDLESLQRRIAAHSRRMAILSHARQHGAVPDYADPDSDEEVRRIVDALRTAERADRIIRPMSAPLRLSYSSIYEYQQCPRCFYAKYVLRFDEPKTDALSIGDVVHRSIEQFLRAHQEAEAEGAPLPGRDALSRIGKDVFHRSTPRNRQIDDDALQRVHSMLETYFERFHDPDAEILVVEGVDADSGDDTAEGGEVQPFAYATADAPEKPHVVTAKPDRIERLSSGGFRVVDYKTGRASQRLLNPKKDDLQLAIYAMAVQSHFSLETPPAGVVEYWLLSSGERGVRDIAEIDFDKVRANIDKAISGMLAGDFERNESKCKGLCHVLTF